MSFVPRQRVYTTCDLDWVHGSGLFVPKHSLIALDQLHKTSAGMRWSGNWLRSDAKVYVYPIPEDSIRPEEFRILKDRESLPETYISQKLAETEAQRLSMETTGLVFVFDCNQERPFAVSHFERGRRALDVKPQRQGA